MCPILLFVNISNLDQYYYFSENVRARTYYPANSGDLDTVLNLVKTNTGYTQAYGEDFMIVGSYKDNYAVSLAAWFRAPFTG